MPKKREPEFVRVVRSIPLGIHGTAEAKIEEIKRDGLIIPESPFAERPGAFPFAKPYICFTKIPISSKRAPKTVATIAEKAIKAAITPWATNASAVFHFTKNRPAIVLFDPTNIPHWPGGLPFEHKTIHVEPQHILSIVSLTDEEREQINHQSRSDSHRYDLIRDKLFGKVVKELKQLQTRRQT